MKKIPPFKLIAQPLDQEARDLPRFKWAPKDVGHRHKLGGEPDFLQREKWPNCPGCGENMTFYGQLDSISDEFCIADCAMVYVFICFGCYETRSIIHSN